ncbi:MAG: MBL fold metallo-hydrolase [Bacillus sp. (in: firmicutes)]
MTTVEQINSTIYCIDCHDLEREKRTGCYILKGTKTTLIETSASPSIPYILKGLEELQINLADIDYIILTHIHLDHAGGAGLLLQKCPNATIIVHPKGAKHLNDPSRLAAGARAVYGEAFDRLFDPIVPIPMDRIHTVEHGEQIELRNRTLTFYHSPGHAYHHIAIHDSGTNGIFTGDTAGISYRELDNHPVDLFLPSTSPSQFNPEAMQESWALFESLKPDGLYFGHYGYCNNPSEVFRQLRHWLPIFIDCGRQAIAEAADQNESAQIASKLVQEKVSEHLAPYGLPDGHAVYEILKLDADISAQGIIDSITKGVISA